MPYSKPSEAPDHVPDDKKAQWIEVWNNVYKKQKADGASDKTAESEAFKQANGVIKNAERGTTMKLEVRTISELRAEGQGDEMSLVGYAALFNTLSRNLGGFVEKIAPGAFSRSLKANADVKVTFNHDPNQVLGRTKSGTATVEQDERGLKFRCQLDPTNTMHRNVYASVKRGDIDECSFAFKAPKDGQTWAEEDGNEDFFAVRTLTDVDLIDVSAVTYPAYYGTNVDARCLFPEGEVAEVRSAIDTIASARAARSVAARAEDQSLQDQIDAVQAAVNEAFPPVKEEGASDCCMPSGRFWTCETYPDSVIVSECKMDGKYFRITYTKDGEGKYIFGVPEEVEQTWVPATPRGIARVAELRSKLHDIAEGHAIHAAAAQAEADAHAQAADAVKKAADMKAECDAMDGDHGDEQCSCQNQMVDPDDAWDDEDGTEDDRKLRKAKVVAEARADGKVRTKTVGGKALTKDKFAFVGDPERTETWKLPIHDAGHVRNALARFGQTQDIPADKKPGVLRKIKAAASKFGIDVSEKDSARMLADAPMDAEEIQDRLLQLRAIVTRP